mmetsp:Transcript_19038/g.52886  ORF Transcript_19038/g.52886 Transcript_19038/m.52886 type:complete len:211 (+) Transcript_19038:240-872(+)
MQFVLVPSTTWSRRRGSAQSLCLAVVEDVLQAAVVDVRSQHLGVDGVPPAVRALDDDIEVGRIDVQVVLRSVVTDRGADVILHLRRDGVLAGVHVGDLRPLQSPRESLPRLVPDVVQLSHVDAPDPAVRLLQYLQQVHQLLVPHAKVEVLNVQSLAVGVLLESVQGSIQDGDRCVRIADVLLHLQNHHLGTVAAELLDKSLHLWRVQVTS